MEDPNYYDERDEYYCIEVRQRYSYGPHGPWAVEPCYDHLLLRDVKDSLRVIESCYAQEAKDVRAVQVIITKRDITGMV